MALPFLVVALANWLAGQLGRLSTDSRSAHPYAAWALLALGLFVAWLVSVLFWAKLDDKPDSVEKAEAGT